MRLRRITKMKTLIWKPLTGLIIYFCLSGIITGSSDFTVKGRIIDDLGNSVTNPQIYLYPINTDRDNITNSDNFLDDIIISIQSNLEGKFSFRPEMKSFALCATYPTDKSAVELLSLDYFCKNNDLETFSINEAENTSLGDIKVSFNYQQIEFKLLNDKFSPYLSKQKISSDIWIRLSDENYQPLQPTRIPLNLINKKNSTIRVYLPEGKWNLEFSLDKRPEVWSKYASIIVNKQHSFQPIQQNVVIEFQISKNEPSPGEARAELDKMNIDHTLISLIDAAFDGNQKVVKLFLDSGFDPNILTENNSTVLMVSVRFPYIVKMLLDKGAKVNQKTVDGNSALIFAAIEGNVNSVKLLLESGSSVNESNNEGKTPLIFAVEDDEEEIVKILLKYGANPTQQNKDGKNAIDIAKELGFSEIVDILTHSSK